MYKYFFTAFMLLSLISCQHQQSKTSDKIIDNKANLVSDTKPELVSISTPEIPSSEEELSDKKELVESFTDNSKVGVPHKNKIEILEFKKSDNIYFVEIKFYSYLKNNEWKLKQTFDFEKYGSMPIAAKLEDFNNDSFNDFTYESALAGRGANEIRKLFIYDKKSDELIYIKNSEEYPNLQYNKELDCLDAWRFYGGTTTTDFVKIKGDKLKEFASVKTLEDKREVFVIDEKGKKTLLRTDKVNSNEGFIRYENFNPIKEY